MSADIERSIILDVAKDKWRMYACVPNIWSSPIAEATFAQPHQQLPVGKWFLDSAKQKALSFLLNNFPAEMVNVSASKTHCLISVQDSAKKTVDAQILEIDERKEKSWRTSKEKGNKVKEKPSKFDWPAEMKNNNNTLLLPDASGMDVAKLHQDVQWIDTEIAVSKQFRESVASFCDVAKAAVIYKARFGVTQMSVFHTHGGDPLEKIKYGKKAKDGLETFFVFDKNDISRAMRAVNFVIGSSPCQLSVSNGDTVLRLSAEQNGGEYNVYIPAGQGGFGYVGNEFSKGRLA